MVKVNPRSAAGFLKRPPAEAAVVVIYGPDRGQVSESAATLVQAVAEDLSDPFRVAELTQAAIADDGALLGDEARALSLTGGRRAVRVRGATDALSKSLEAYLEDPSPDSVIVVEAGELTGRSSLRKLAEKDARAAAIACYRDEGAGLANLIKEVTSQHQIRVSADAVRYLTTQLGADRQSSRNALEKLCLYAGPGGQIDLEAAEMVVGDVSQTTQDELAQAVAAGRAGEAERLSQKLLVEGVNNIALLRSLVRHFSRIAEARGHVDAGASPEAAIGKLRPPVFFRAKSGMMTAARLWNAARLQAVLNRLLQAEIDCKTSGMPADLICMRTVLAIAAAAPKDRR